MHFNETFAPVARRGSIRLLVALASNYGMHIRQLNVTTAYLNGPIDEVVYMEPPSGLSESLKFILNSESRNQNIRAKSIAMLKELEIGDRVCLLRKSLYGLRQAGKNWYFKLDSVLHEFGVMPTESDPCVYQAGRGEDSLIVAVYVDDILVASRDDYKINDLKEHLAMEFEIKDLGQPKCCLGIEFSRKGNQILLNQNGYINEILMRFGINEWNTAITPIDIDVKLELLMENVKREKQEFSFREVVGALTYLATSTRPDIAHAVSALSQFNDRNGPIHWTAAERVLRYLKRTADAGLVFEPSLEPLKGYSDAGWGSCPVDRHSYTGYAFALGNGIISWESRKQTTVALSSTEAEYISATEAAREAVHLQEYLKELGFDALARITMFCDNMSALKLAKNPTYHARTKHIPLRYHFIRHVIRENRLNIKHLRTEDMLADVLTKGLSGPKHRRCMELMNMKSSIICSDQGSR